MNPVIKLFANVTLAETLSLFILHPEEEFYQSDIARKIKKALMQIQRTLKTLQEIGLIACVQRGRMMFYRAVRSHPAFEDLKRLFLKTIGLGESIRQLLTPFHNRIQYVFIFGSVAKGDESFDSDIDLFIVADLTLRELSKVLSPFSKELRRELNPVIFSRDELQKKISEKDHFLIKVLGSPKLWILGSENELNGLVKRRKTKNS